MSRKPTEEWFRTMRRGAEEAHRLRLRTDHVLSMRQLRSFDGLGHFLDEVLPDEQDDIDRIATAVQMSTTTLSRLRASRLDPLSVSPGPLVLLGYVLGLAPEQLEDLVVQDHERFMPFGGGVVERGEPRAMSDQLRSLREAWARTVADDATDL